MSSVKQDYLSVVSNGKISSHSNAIDEINVATTGLNVTAVNLLSKKLHWDIASLAKAIGTTTHTLDRHRVEKKRLGIKISENALELARLSTIGTDYFGDIHRWNEWLDTPNIQFSNQSPKSVIHTIRGRELIRHIIRSLEYGFTA